MVETSKESRDEYTDDSLKRKSIPLESENILCVHCKRTKNNENRCLGICVADSDY